MKRVLFTLSICLVAICLQSSAFAQKINVIFQNNSTEKGARKFKLEVENPDGTKTTENFALEATRRQTVALEIGAKVFVTNTKALNTIQGGAEVSNTTPFMTVVAKDKNQVMNLVEETNASQNVITENVTKSASKLKLPTDASSESTVSGNTVTTKFKDKKGNAIAEFDTDKKTGNVKLITDLRKK